MTTTLGTSYFFVETLLCCQLRVRFERRAGKKWRQYYNTTIETNMKKVSNLSGHSSRQEKGSTSTDDRH